MFKKIPISVQPSTQCTTKKTEPSGRQIINLRRQQYKIYERIHGSQRHQKILTLVNVSAKRTTINKKDSVRIILVFSFFCCAANLNSNNVNDSKASVESLRKAQKQVSCG